MAEDQITYQRIVGLLRLGLYRTPTPEDGPQPIDVLCHYGICFIEGQYDNSGIWTATRDPRVNDHLDDDDPWFFQFHPLLSLGEQYVPAGNTTTVEPTWWARERMPSTDRMLPNGSFLDIKPKRKAQYAHKLHLIVAADTAGDPTPPDGIVLFCNWNLRILQSKYG